MTLTKIGISQHTLVELPDIKFHNNPSIILNFLHMERYTKESSSMDNLQGCKVT